MTSRPSRFSLRNPLSRRKAKKEKTPGQQTSANASTSTAIEAVPQPQMPQAVRSRSPELVTPLTETSPLAADNQTEMPASTVDLAERLWNQAYDQLKAMEPALVEAYERIILSQILDDNGSFSETLESRETRVQKSLPSRQKMMTLVVEKGLKNAEKQARTRKTGRKTLTSMMDLINTAIPASPDAYLAWSGVSLTLEILVNPATSQLADLEGIVHIASRMKWYLEVPNILCMNRINGESYASLRAHVEMHILDLYQAIILYQINVICSNYRSRAVVFLRGIVGLDRRDEDLARVLDAEEAVKMDLEMFDQQMASSLRDLANDIRNREKTTLQGISEQLQAIQLTQLNESDQECLQRLCLTDPRDNKTRFEDQLLEGTYNWILDSPEFKEWQDKDKSILWIEGAPGTGKTMLMTGIINHLEGLVTASDAEHLSYFFCQATDARMNNAAVVLRGLIFLLIAQQSWLISHLRPRYSVAGKQLFEDINAFYALSAIFQDMLQDPRLTQVYLVVDALDECGIGLRPLLDLIAQTARTPATRVKWIVSSRHHQDVENQLISRYNGIRLSLDKNSESVAFALDEYINMKVSQLEQISHNKHIQDEIRTEVRQKANGSFLWTSTVFRELQRAEEYEIHGLLDDILREGSGELTPLYDRMTAQIEELGAETRRLCFSVLSIVALAYRPLHLLELPVLAGLGDHLTGEPTLREILADCGSFLTVQDDFIYLLHQSVMDYLVDRILRDRPSIHFDIFSRSLQALSEILRRDIYDIKHAGTLSDSAKLKTPNRGPLASVRYSSVFWANHICDAVKDTKEYYNALSDDGEVSSFLKIHFLHLLESLSLLGQLSDGILSLRLLLSVTQHMRNPNRQFVGLLTDAERFARSSSWVIERFPLQTYGAALVFCPTKSVIKQLYWQERFPLVKSVEGVRDLWDGCLQTLEGHNDIVRAVSFSPDGRVLASASSDNSVLLWETAVGTNIKTLEGHSGTVFAVSFSPDNKLIASASSDKTVCLWDAETGIKHKVLKGHSGIVRTLTFSSDPTKFVTTSRDNTVLFWNAAAETHERILGGQSFDVNSAVLSPDSHRIALALGDTVQVYSFPKCSHEKTFTGHGSVVYGLAFSPDSKRIASSSHDNTVRLWDVGGGVNLTLNGHTGAVFAVAFSSDGHKLASASSDKTVRFWDAATGAHIRTLEGHRDWVNAIAFSPDNRIIASSSHDKTVRLWDAEMTWEVETDNNVQMHKIRTITFSPDGKMLASISGDWKVQLWNAAKGIHRLSIESQNSIVTNVAFSPNGEMLASASNDKMVRLWGTGKGDLKWTLKGHSRRINAVVFSPDNSMLASASNDKTVRLWKTDTGDPLRTLTGHLDWVSAVAFASDCEIVASASSDKTVRLWRSETCILVIEITQPPKILSFSEDGKDLNIGRRWVDVKSGAASTRKDLTQSVCRTSLVEDWITRDGENVLWLPPDYRPTCSAFHGDLAVLGHESGRLTFLEFMSG